MICSPICCSESVLRTIPNVLQPTGIFTFASDSSWVKKYPYQGIDKSKTPAILFVGTALTIPEYNTIVTQISRSRDCYVVDIFPGYSIKTMKSLVNFFNSSYFANLFQDTDPSGRPSTITDQDLVLIGHSATGSLLLNLFYNNTLNIKNTNNLTSLLNLETYTNHKSSSTPKCYFTKRFTVKNIVLLDPVGTPAPLKQNPYTKIMGIDSYTTVPGITSRIFAEVNNNIRNNTSIDCKVDGGGIVFNHLFSKGITNLDCQMINPIGLDPSTNKILSPDPIILSKYDVPVSIKYPTYHIDYLDPSNTTKLACLGFEGGEFRSRVKTMVSDYVNSLD